MEGVKRAVKKLLPDGARRKVANLYHLFEAIAANIRYGFPARGMKVVMVTGTNGKTTTATFVASVLKAQGMKVGVMTTAYFEINNQRFDRYQNETVLPAKKLQQKLLEMKKHGVEVVVLEVTSHGLEQHRVWGVPCEVAVMTNLTQDHLDYHGTMERYAAAKAKLFAARPRFVVLNHDDDWFDYFDQFPPGEQSMTYGTHVDADCRLMSANLHREGSKVEVEIDHQTRLSLVIHLPGKFNVYNAMAAAATGYVLHVHTSAIEEGIEAVKTIAGRQQRIDEGQAFDVLVDYAHSPDALEQLLGSIKQLSKHRLIAVFGSAGGRDKEKRPLMGEVAARYADRIIITDDETYGKDEDPATIRRMILSGIKKAGADAKTEEIADRRAAIEKALSIARRGDTVVLAGMGHEQFRVINGERTAWSDADVARELLRS